MNELSYIDVTQNWLQTTNFLSFFLQGTLLYFAIFWFALLIWVTRDIINRTNNVVFQAAVIILNTVLPLFGLVIYLLIRPSRTLMEKYYDELEYKALGVEKFCPKCSCSVQESFLFCPECGEGLKNACVHCKKDSFQSYKLCPFCGKDKHVILEKKSELQKETPKEEKKEEKVFKVIAEKNHEKSSEKHEKKKKDHE